MCKEVLDIQNHKFILRDGIIGYKGVDGALDFTHIDKYLTNFAY